MAGEQGPLNATEIEQLKNAHAPEKAPVEKPIEKPIEKPVDKAPVEKATKEEETEEVDLTGKVLSDDVTDEQIGKYTDKQGNITLPWRSFKTRIARARKAELKAVFGTDDREAILKSKSDYEQMLTEREKKAREQQTELEKAQADAKKEKEARESAERALEQHRESAELEKVESQVSGVAAQHFAPDYVDYAVNRFRKHVAKLDDDEIAEIDEEGVAKWFAEFAVKHPAMAREAAKPKDDDKKSKDEKAGKDKKKVLVTNGTDDHKPDAKGAGEKAVKDMSKAEIKEKFGYSW